MFQNIRTKLQSVTSYLVLVPLLVAVSIITLSLWATIVSSSSLEATKSQSVDRLLRESRLRIIAGLRSYAQLANGGVARINSGEINSKTWANFVSTYDLERNYPGVYSVGVNQIVASGNESAYEQEKSADYGRTIAIFPASNFQKRTPVTYVQPETERTKRGIGLDSYTEPPRRSAMDRAAAQNQIIITDKLNFFTNAPLGERSPEPSFIMYAPYYDLSLPAATESQRAEAARGFVFVAFVAKDVIDSFFANSDMSRTAVSVYASEKNEENRVYQKPASAQNGKTVTAEQSIELYGQSFVFDYEFDEEALVSRTQITAPTAIAVSGIVLAIMLAAITFFSLRSRHLKLLFEKEREVKMAKDELLSLASHQLRTPATGVKQYMGMVLQGFAGDITKQQQEYLEKAYESNDRQLQIINDILHLAKLDAGRIVLSKRDFDLAAMVRSVADEQADEAEKGGIGLKTRVPKKAMYNGDSHMFRMVIENLVSNAIKYSPQGSKVSITLKKEADCYKLIVRDTGVGIDTADFPKLFKQFSRISNERSHLVSGTGVGLYLADNLTRLHGGEITVTSSLHKGSEFTVILPFSV